MILIHLRLKFINTKLNLNFLVTTWYRPPNSPIHLLAKFENIQRLIDIEEKDSIIMGDLNCDLLPKDLDHNYDERTQFHNEYIDTKRTN